MPQSFLDDSQPSNILVEGGGTMPGIEGQVPMNKIGEDAVDDPEVLFSKSLFSQSIFDFLNR